MKSLEQIQDWVPAAPPAGWHDVTRPVDAAKGVRAFVSEVGSTVVMFLERVGGCRVWLHLRVCGPMRSRPSTSEIHRVIAGFVKPVDTSRRLAPLNPRVNRGSSAFSLRYRIRGGR